MPSSKIEVITHTRRVGVSNYSKMALDRVVSTCNNIHYSLYIACERYILSNYPHIRHWVEDLPKMGRSSFTLDDVRAQFPDMSSESMHRALDRLSIAGKVQSIWRGFYAIVLPEYGLDGNIPPVEYIDQLMAYAEADYYVALLSAASYQGASHQAPQVFQVISNKQMRSKTVAGTQLEFALKTSILKDGIEQKMMKSGYVNVSVPALTALDLVRYPSRSGGISHAASVIAELADVIDFATLDEDVLRAEPRATVQRLGYLLEDVIGEAELARELYEKCQQMELRFFQANLVPKQESKRIGYSSKWKIVINYDVEVDE